MRYSADYWIEKLDLKKHPEGGYYKEFYRSNEVIDENSLPERFRGTRCLSTSIYFLLRSDEYSAFHRIKSDEIWYFHAGTALILYIIEESGELSVFKLGSNFENDEQFQITIPKESWFAAKVIHKNSFTLVGCTVAPGFEFADFELGKKDKLIQKYPQHKEILDSLCK
ncbi:MAG: cupin domain-containing protein [Saprospiraceae bacterium]|nr:cupin domain-containing protein [Saprospiraceae bacterium]